ncbi:MAG TPA: cyclodeaminase/cyclohydrolase family protein [Actinomycetota bacterium]|nr:cyclodeaminase/cyclohydrolase family protein [Actinomycetota bacterium]
MSGFREMTLDGFLERLASSDPTPGGGAVAGAAGAAGAALISMVGRLTVGKKGFEDVTPRMQEIVARADAARMSFLDLADRDAAAFDDVMSAMRMRRDSDEEKAERTEAMQRALAAAAEAPLQTARLAVGMMELALEATGSGNPHASSDGSSAAQMLRAAATCAAYNVEINAASIKDAAAAGRLRSETADLLGQADALLRKTDEAFRARIAG